MPDTPEREASNPFGTLDDLPKPKKKKSVVDLGAIDRAESKSDYIAPPSQKKAPVPKQVKPAPKPVKPAPKPVTKTEPKLTVLQRRRQANPKPETERYTARLEPETILFFADYADKHGLPMREVFKRAAQALKDSSE